MTIEERIVRIYAPWQDGEIALFREVVAAMHQKYQQEPNPRLLTVGGNISLDGECLGIFFNGGDIRRYVNLSDFLQNLDYDIDHALGVERDFLSNRSWLTTEARTSLKGPRTGNNFIPHLATNYPPKFDFDTHPYFPSNLMGDKRNYALAASKAAKRCDILRNSAPTKLIWPIAYPEIFRDSFQPEEGPRPETYRFCKLLDKQKDRWKFIEKREKKVRKNSEAMAKLYEHYIQICEACGEALINHYEFTRLVLQDDFGIELPKRIRK